MSKKPYRTPTAVPVKLHLETVIMDSTSTFIPIAPDENVDNSHKSGKLHKPHKALWNQQ